MKLETTNRGFSIANFEDSNGVACSIQKSSIADENKIWIGCNQPNPEVLIDGEWTDIVLPKGTVSNTRMHLNQEQVEFLIPHLQRFVETGELE